MKRLIALLLLLVGISQLAPSHPAVAGMDDWTLPNGSLTSPRTPHSALSSVSQDLTEMPTGEVADTFGVAPQPTRLCCAEDPVETGWSARVGAVILQRSRPSSTPFVLAPSTGNNIIDPANFDLPFRGGLDVGLVRYGSVVDLDFRYFGVNQWSASQGPFLSPSGFIFPVQGFNDNANFPLNVAGEWRSNLQSAEFNLRRNLSSRFGLLAGLRYVTLRERASFMVGDNNFNNGTEIFLGTVNNLFGVQVGADGILWENGRRFRIEGALKTGIYGNGARFSLGANSIGGGGGGNVVNWWGHDHTAFVGDLSTTGVYQINDRWAARLGYQLLWLSGVAIPSEQLHGINLADGQILTNTSHSAFFHGALASIERTW